MFKSKLTNVLIGGLILLIANTVQANCSITGHIYYVSTTATTSDTAFVLINPSYTSGLPTVSYVFTLNTNDDRASEFLAAAFASDIEVQITGNALSCPSTGTQRNAGNVLTAAIVPRF